MGGFASHKATTGFVVRDLDLEPETYSRLLFDSLEAGGWVTAGSSADRAWVRAWAEEHLEMAADLPVEMPLHVENDRVTVKRSGRE